MRREIESNERTIDYHSPTHLCTQLDFHSLENWTTESLQEDDWRRKDMNVPPLNSKSTKPIRRVSSTAVCAWSTAGSANPAPVLWSRKRWSKLPAPYSGNMFAYVSSCFSNMAGQASVERITMAQNLQEVLECAKSDLFWALNLFEGVSSPDWLTVCGEAKCSESAFSQAIVCLCQPYWWAA